MSLLTTATCVVINAKIGFYAYVVPINIIIVAIGVSLLVLTVWILLVTIIIILQILYLNAVKIILLSESR